MCKTVGIEGTSSHFGEIFFRLVTEKAYSIKYICYIQAWWLNGYLLSYDVFSYHASIENFCSINKRWGRRRVQGCEGI